MIRCKLFPISFSRAFIAVIAVAAAVYPVASVSPAFAADEDEESLGILDQDLTVEETRRVNSIVGDRVSDRDLKKNTSLVKKSLWDDSDMSVSEQRKKRKALKNVGKPAEGFQIGGRDSDAKLSRRILRHSESSRKVKVVNRAEEEKAAAKSAKKAAKKKKQEQKRAAQLARKNPFH